MLVLCRAWPLPEGGPPGPGTVGGLTGGAGRNPEAGVAAAPPPPASPCILLISVEQCSSPTRLPQTPAVAQCLVVTAEKTALFLPTWGGAAPKYTLFPPRTGTSVYGQREGFHLLEAQPWAPAHPDPAHHPE